MEIANTSFLMVTLRRLLVPLLVAATLPLPSLSSLSVAQASDPIDVVFTRDGGRLRGTVIEESRSSGTTIRLLDGTVRKVKASDVAHVDYAPSPASPAAPPPAPAVAIVAPPAAAVLVPAVETAPVMPVVPAERDVVLTTTQMHMRSPGLAAAGVVVVGLGAVATVAGVVVFKNGGAHTASYESCGDLGCVPETESYSDDTSTRDGAILIAGGSVAMVTGLILTVVGAHQVPVNVTTRASSATAAGAAAADFSWMPTVMPHGAGIVGHF